MHPRDRSHAHWPRAWRLAALTAAALSLHAALLGGVRWMWPAPIAAPTPVAALEVRVLAPPPAPIAPVAPSVDMAAPRAAGDPAPAQRRVKRLEPLPSGLSVLRATPVSVVQSMPHAAPISAGSAPARLALATTVPAAAPVGASAPVDTADDEPIPHYRTRMPPPGTLRYQVSRGVLRGIGELVWRPENDRYELSFDFKLSGLTILSQASSGGFDAEGVAPTRFTDQRVRRGTVAANFQRAADKITYSGSRREYPLRAGAQDRLSWMVQLAAIVAAEPQLARPGGKVLMFVTGANGDASVWVFRCVGAESIEARGARVEAIKFVREPRDVNDTSVEVWLDPLLHDLPVRATQRSGPEDDAYELRLIDTALSR